MKVGYKKRKGKKERVRRRREDAAEDMAMSADGDTTPVMSREGVAVPIVAPPGMTRHDDGTYGKLRGMIVTACVIDRKLRGPREPHFAIPAGSPAAALSDDDCKEGELDMMVGPSHISQPSMDRSGAESPTSPGKHMTARERHRCVLKCWLRY